MSYAVDIFTNEILSWRETKGMNHRIEILLENPLPLTPENYALGEPEYRTVGIDIGEIRLTYYGFLMQYHLWLGEKTPLYASSAIILNKYANEVAQDVWVNGVRWGIDAPILKMILEEAKDKEFTQEERCPICGTHVDYEYLVRQGKCTACINSEKLLKEGIRLQKLQEIWVVKGARCKIKDNMFYTDSHVVIKDTWGRKPKRELVRGRLHKNEELVSIKF